MATLALVCTLSVFNGFQDMVAGLFTAFDPELKIMVREGKVFEPNGAAFQEVRSLPEIDVFREDDDQHEGHDDQNDVNNPLFIHNPKVFE